MKRIILIVALAISTLSIGAKNIIEVDTIKQEKRLRTEVKLNALVAVGVINPAIEVRISDRFTFQLDGLATFYEKNFLGTGKPLTLITMFLEGRYYINPYFRGFYVGAHCGAGVFKMNKGVIPGYGYDTDSYQMGYNIMAGITLGYKLKLTTHWALDFHWSGGYQFARYEGFSRESPEDPYTAYIGLNASAEWLPAYKGGISVCYRW